MRIETIANRFILKTALVVFAALFSFTSFDASARDATLISQKLWRKFTQEESDLLKKIDVALNKKDYDQALKYAKTNSFNPLLNQGQAKPAIFDVVSDIVLWNKYSGDISKMDIDFSDISRFASDNPFYPNIYKIKRNVERVAMKDNVAYEKTGHYFTSNPAGSIDSKLYLLKAKIKFLQEFHGSEAEKTDLKNSIRYLISTIWIKEDFATKDQEDTFFMEYKPYLSANDHVKRVERLLWEDRTSQAQSLMVLIDEDYRKLFHAIIELQSFPRYMQKSVLSVPRHLRGNELLAYRKVLWYKSKGRIDDVMDVIIALPRELEYPEKWWSLRHLYAREMLKEKRYKLSYLLAAKNSLPADAADFWEAQWLSGWIALRFLDEPEAAYNHFELLYNNVQQPVTLARASYWLGMASLAMGRKKEALNWYKVATQYPTFFYGQLAITKHRSLDSIAARDDIILPKDPAITSQDMENVARSKAARVAYLLAMTGDKTNATKIFDYIVSNAATKGEVAVIMKIVNEIDDRQLDARISRTAAKKNVFFIKDKFQIIDEVSDDKYAPLVHAIIKQESGFAPTAVSKVGALGFMQLMPNTAKLVARDLGIEYDKTKLSTDIKYNIRLGTSYIKSLINRFEGSEIMAIAAYNAGPNNAQRWANEFYDPRLQNDLDKVVDWIELITYSETRNYVQRIMENLIVYKYLMSRSNYDALE